MSRVPKDTISINSTSNGLCHTEMDENSSQYSTHHYQRRDKFSRKKLGPKGYLLVLPYFLYYKFLYIIF